MREIFIKCDLGIHIHEESIIGDVFIANMQEIQRELQCCGEIQNELLKETRCPKKALELASNVKIGMQTPYGYR